MSYCIVIILLHMKVTAIRVLFALILLISSCSEETAVDPVIPSGLIDSSLLYFDGEVISSVNSQVNEIDAWEVKIQNSNASLVSIYWRIEPMILLQIEGTRGPFDYDISPGNILINLSTARTIAMVQAHETNMIHWILRQNTYNSNDNWVYVFEFEKEASISVKAFVDASNGNIL